MPGTRAEATVERGRAAGLGEGEPAARAAQHGGDAVGREVRLDREVGATRPEDGEHRRHPVESAPGDHGHDVLGLQPAVQQCVADPVHPVVERRVRQDLVTVLGGHPVRVGRGAQCEQIRQPQVGELAPSARPGRRPGHGARRAPTRLASSCGASGSATMLGERGQVVADDPRGRPGVQDVAAMAQRDDRRPLPPDTATPNTVSGDSGPEPARGVQLGLERRAGQPQLVTEPGHRKCVVGQQVGLGPCGRVAAGLARRRRGRTPGTARDVGRVPRRTRSSPRRSPDSTDRTLTWAASTSVAKRHGLAAVPAGRARPAGRRERPARRCRSLVGLLRPARDAGGRETAQDGEPVLAAHGRDRTDVLADDLDAHETSCAGLPAHRVCGGASWPFIRNESGARTTPSPTVVAVVDERCGAEGAPGADHDPVGLEGAVLLRVRLHDAAHVERAVVADRGQGLLDDRAAVVEDPATDPDSDAAAR